MPEATVLYSVTAVVIVALVVWVAYVLKTAKEPWAKPPLPAVRVADVAVEPGETTASEAKADEANAEAKAEAKANAGAKADADEEAVVKGEEAAK